MKAEKDEAWVTRKSHRRLLIEDRVDRDVLDSSDGSVQLSENYTQNKAAALQAKSRYNGKLDLISICCTWKTW